MPAPSSQKADVRPISFVLWDKAAQQKPQEVRLSIRPEDLTVSEPSRVAVQQTLGGTPWIDDFGRGIKSVVISGHTGWRAGINGRDGIERFMELRETVYANWHERRAAAVANGIDPNKVELLFSDALDRIASIVVPTNFVLRRSKSSPLLCHFSINMLAVSDIDIVDQPPAPLRAGDKEKAGVESLLDSINKITAFIKGINKYIQDTIVAPLRAFMQKTVALLTSVKNMVGAINSVFDSTIQIARLAAAAGANIMHSLAMVADLPSQVKAKLMEVGAAYTNAFCVLSNAFGLKKYYQDYSPILGASNCSSTAGGAPLSQFASANTFAAIAPVQKSSPVTVTSLGMSGLRTLASADLVQSPLSSGALSSAVAAANNGLKVAA